MHRFFFLIFHNIIVSHVIGTMFALHDCIVRLFSLFFCNVVTIKNRKGGVRDIKTQNDGQTRQILTI